MFEFLRNLYKRNRDRTQNQNPNAPFTNADNGYHNFGDMPEMKRESQEREHKSQRDHQAKTEPDPTPNAFKKEEDDAAHNREKHNERIRQQAKKAREEKERLEREKAEAEKQRWAQSWSLYIQRWDILEGMHHSMPFSCTDAYHRQKSILTEALLS